MHQETADELAPLIICLIEDRHVGCDDWVAWATVELVRGEGAPAWLAELTTTYSIDDALGLLRSRQRGPTVQDRLGSLWLAHVAHELGPIEVLELALEAAGGWDTGGGFLPYQRELMALLRRVEGLAMPGGREPLHDIERDAGALLSPLGEQIRRRVAGRIAMKGLPSTTSARGGGAGRA
jgi:hypothetical protein